MRRRQVPSTVLVLLLVSLASCREQPAGFDWEQWRGPNGLGVSEEAGLPVTWGPEGTGWRWRAEVPGVGNSSPIVSRGLVFLTSWTEGENFLVLAYDFDSGKKVWQKRIRGLPLARWSWLSTRAAATPAADGERIYVNFGFKLAALNYGGRVLWERSLEKDRDESPVHGPYSSPVLDRRRVFVMMDNEQGDRGVGWLAAFDKRTGEELWRDEWTHNCCSYTTPILVERGAKQELVATRPAEFVAYDPETGSQLWRHGHRYMIKTFPSMVAGGDVLAAAGGHSSPGTVVVRLEGNGRDTKAKPLWNFDQDQPTFSSPLVYDGLLFMVSEQGVMTCYDLVGGERHWREKLRGGAFRASLVAGDGKVYVLDELGTTFVVAAEARFKLLAINRLHGEGTEEPAYANSSPALAHGSVLIRSLGQLFRIEGVPSDPASEDGIVAEQDSVAVAETESQPARIDPAEQRAGEIEETIKAWAEAWSRRDVEEYLSFYAPGFRPESGLTRSQWVKLRNQRLTQAQGVTVDVSDIREIRASKRGGTEVEVVAVAFLQSYSSETYRDEVTKILELKKRHGAWEIVRETVE